MKRASARSVNERARAHSSSDRLPLQLTRPSRIEEKKLKIQNMLVHSYYFKFIFIIFNLFVIFFLLFNNTHAQCNARARHASPSPERQKPLEDKAPRKILRLNNSDARARPHADTPPQSGCAMQQRGKSSSSLPGTRRSPSDRRLFLPWSPFDRIAHARTHSRMHTLSQSHACTQTHTHVLIFICFFIILKAKLKKKVYV